MWYCFWSRYAALVIPIYFQKFRWNTAYMIDYHMYSYVEEMVKKWKNKKWNYKKRNESNIDIRPYLKSVTKARAVPNQPKLELNSMSCLVVKVWVSKSELELKQITARCGSIGLNCQNSSRPFRIFGQIDLYKPYKPLVYLPDIDLC